MSPIELKIHVLARVMSELDIPDLDQKRETFERTLTSLVNYAMMRREIDQLEEAVAEVERVRVASKQSG